MFPNLSILHIKGDPLLLEDNDSSEHSLSHLIFDDLETTLPTPWEVRRITYTNPLETQTVFELDPVAACHALASLRLRTDTPNPFFGWDSIADVAAELRALIVRRAGRRSTHPLRVRLDPVNIG